MAPWLKLLLDAVFPPKDEVFVARAVTPEELGALVRPRLVEEAWMRVFFSYRDPKVRALIRSIKFYGETAVIPRIAEVCAGHVSEMISDRVRTEGWDVPLLIPMPSSKKRLRDRGYNQAERIAEAFARELTDSVVYAPGTILREDRKSQVRIAREERARNIYGAFRVAPGAELRGKQVILIDDVIESGSTMKDARRALTAAGVGDVLGIALAN